MLRISYRLGNIHQDSALAARVTQWEQAQQLEEVTINEREAQKSRLRLQTATGQDLGLGPAPWDGNNGWRRLCLQR